MIATLLKELADKIAQVSGKKIKFVPVRGLDVLARVKLAPATGNEHCLYFSAANAPGLSYAMAFECARILRFFEVDESERQVAVTTKDMRKKAYSMFGDIADRSSFSGNEEVLEKMQAAWYGGIVRRVTTYPGDVKIHIGLAQRCPELKDDQQKLFAGQLTKAEGDLAEEVKKQTPSTIFELSGQLNAAYFKLLERQFPELEFNNIIGNSFAEGAEQLVKVISDTFADSYEGDVAKSQLWAAILGISDWFAWMKIKDITSETDKQSF